MHSSISTFGSVLEHLVRHADLFRVDFPVGLPTAARDGSVFYRALDAVALVIWLHFLGGNQRAALYQGHGPLVQEVALVVSGVRN